MDVFLLCMVKYIKRTFYGMHLALNWTLGGYKKNFSWVLLSRSLQYKWGGQINPGKM